MKISLKQLKQIIKEETENYEMPTGDKMELTKLIHSAMELCDSMTKKPGDRFSKCAEKLVGAYSLLDH